MRHWKSIAVGAGSAAVTFVIALLVWHLWVDHQTLHVIVGVINGNVQSGHLAVPGQPPASPSPPAPVK